MKTSSISSVFGDVDAEPLFVTDSAELRAWMMDHYGLKCDLLDSFAAPRPDGIVLVPTRWESLPPAAELRRQLRGTRVLWVPLASFDPSPPAARYAIRLLLESDFSKTVSNNRSIMMRLLTAPQKMTFRGGFTDLEFTLKDEVYVNSRSRLSLADGEHASIGAYFEVELGANWVEMEETFHVYGQMQIEGALVAHHREMPAAVQANMPAAEELLAELRWRLPLVVTLEDSRIVPGAFGDLDEALRELTNPTYDGLLTELAFGTNTAVQPHVDWSVNSQLNEGMGGIHIALGDGLSGAHMDFVCSQGELAPLS